MIGRAFTISLMLVTAMISVQASPFDELASPIPETRANAAAQILAQRLEPPIPRQHWIEVFSGIDPTRSDSGDLLCSRLSRIRRDLEWSPAEIPRDMKVDFQLDPYWQIQFSFRQGRLIEYQITPREVEARPPVGYSGFWKTYRADGTVAAIYDYQKGENLGNTLHMK